MSFSFELIDIFCCDVCLASENKPDVAEEQKHFTRQTISQKEKYNKNQVIAGNKQCVKHILFCSVFSLF